MAVSDTFFQLTGTISGSIKTVWRIIEQPDDGSIAQIDRSSEGSAGKTHPGVASAATSRLLLENVSS